MSGAFAESNVRDAALAWMGASGWEIAHGADIAPDMPAAERAGCREWMLIERFVPRIGS